MRTNLFCFPFAGGSKYSYNGFTRLAGKKIRLIAMDYPGRGLRFKERLLTDIRQVAEDSFNKIKDNLHDNYAIYGHSMGAVVSYLLAKRIQDEGLPPPVHLFLTGRGGPSAPMPETARYLLPGGEFRELLREMGGNSEEVLNDEDLMKFFEPILRADFEAVETYRHVPSAPLDIPITVMIGDQEKVTTEQAEAWQKETTQPVDIRVFSGKHFFIFDQAEAMMKIVEQKLALSAASSHY